MSESIDAAALLEPVSDADPCGPDLEAAGDADFMNFLADAEGRLPAAFFSFDSKSIDFEALFRSANELLDRTRDVRLFVLLAKLSLLRRDLDGFAGWLEVLRRQLDENWDHVNPKGEDGDYLARMAPLYTLDDGPVVILPLQHVTLARAERDGTVTFRAHLVASGEVRARENEHGPDATAIERILLNVEMAELESRHSVLLSIKSALADIRKTATGKAGFEQAVKLETLPVLVDRMAAFLQAAITRRDPGAAPEAVASEADGDGDQEAGDAPRSAAKPGEITTRAEADALLRAALEYFVRNEPSSPAVLLIGQSRMLLGKNLYEVMQILVPNHADSARVYVGTGPVVAVPVSSVQPTEEGGDGGDSDETPVAENRQAALALLNTVAAYCRVTEPSSPIPLLLERARTMASRDFLGLLKDLFSEDVLSSMKIGGS